MTIDLRISHLVPAVNVSVASDLAADRQMLVVADHDSRVLARGKPPCRAWQLADAVDWAAQAVRTAFAGVTVSCERLGTAGGCSASWLASAGAVRVRANAASGLGEAAVTRARTWTRLAGERVFPLVTAGRRGGGHRTA